MANTDRPAGFVPYGPVLRQGLYAVNTAPTINICVGDIVVSGGAIVTTPKGFLQDVLDAAVPASAAANLGAVLSVMDSDGDTVKYLAPSTAGNSTIAGYIIVADHPDQRFIAQEDGATNAIDLSEGGQNADIICATLCAPNTVTGLSTQEIDSDSAGTSAGLVLKLLHPHINDTPADDSDVGCRWVVQINEHYYGDTMAGS